MTEDEKIKLWDEGWNAFWLGKTEVDCSHFDQDVRDEWMFGWLSAKEVEHINPNDHPRN